LRERLASVPTVELEPGSFRDPDSRVFYGEDGVYRALSERGLADFRALADSSLFERAIAAGKLVRTELLDAAAVVQAPAIITTGCAGVLRHERVPFVSYPYEWPYSMLKDAALLQLELLEAALRRDLILKDATPYNVQWHGARPVFVDVGSFEPLRAGEPWVGYRQFCMLFLNPLLLQGLTGVPFHPWLRGALDGIAPGELAGALSLRDRFRRGLLTNVFLHARLERRYGSRSREVKSELRSAGFDKRLIAANVRGMQKLVRRLDWRPPSTVWTEYEKDKSYTDADAASKDAFVRDVVTAQPWELVWDIGANTGRYARIAAEGARYVVAIDADQAPVELLYRELREEGVENVLPLTMNLANPSPGLGWRGLERKTLEQRGTPDLALALAVVHHMTISANVPLRDVVGWFASLGGALVIEFPHREDRMVQTLLAAKRDGLHPDYEQRFFERCLAEAFDVERRETLASGTRTLYFARPKGSGSPIDLAPETPA
jgi:SAM-dependent methyltransferase